MPRIWESLSARARLGLGLGVAAIAVLTVVLARWTLAKDYQVLFADLADRDAAAMVAELERMKLPYELAADGSKILVPRAAVHRTRLQLVAKNLPSHGGVGFEIFNNADFGMTEFAQKVNYQRALQGELTRTILALDEVQSARVHLVLPEGGLFRRAEQQAKASVTLALKPGRELEKAQIIGIQRLVAASVPDIDMKRVTVLGSSGVALSAPATGPAADSADWKLDTKRQVEDHLVRKLAALFDRALGPGRAAVSVDVELNFDNVKITAEEVVPAVATDPAERLAGVLVRERQTLRSAAAAQYPAQGPASGAAEAGREAALTSRDNEYQAGRRVQQIVSTPGSVKRITVGVVLPTGVDAAQTDKLRDLVVAAAGLDKSRGDGVAIHALARGPGEPGGAAVAGAPAAPAAPAGTAMPMADAPAPPLSATTGLAGRTGFEVSAAVQVIAVLALLLGGLALYTLGRQATRARRGAGPGGPVGAAALTEAQRQALLADLRQWLAVEGEAAAAESASGGTPGVAPVGT